MELSQFKLTSLYTRELKTQDSEIKSKHFDTAISALLKQHPTLMIRDYLDIDCTFAVVSRYRFDLREAVDLYTSICDVLVSTTYMKVANNGLITIDDYSGFWVHLK